jgi:hypothetical protein
MGAMLRGFPLSGRAELVDAIEGVMNETSASDSFFHCAVFDFAASTGCLKKGNDV